MTSKPRAISPLPLNRHRTRRHNTRVRLIYFTLD